MTGIITIDFLFNVGIALLGGKMIAHSSVCTRLDVGRSVLDGLGVNSSIVSFTYTDTRPRRTQSYSFRLSMPQFTFLGLASGL